MSNYQSSGRLSDNGSTDTVVCSGTATLSSHIDNGTGVMTWQFKGPSGEWETIYGGTTGTTAQVFTDQNHMVNVYFGGDVVVKGVLSSGGGTPRFDWQIISSLDNK